MRASMAWIESVRTAFDYMEKIDRMYNDSHSLLEYLKSSTPSEINALSTPGHILRRYIEESKFYKQNMSKNKMAIALANQINLTSNFSAKDFPSDEDLEEFMTAEANSRYFDNRKSGKIGQNWLNEKVYFPIERESVISICFALRLDFEQSSKLLNSLGHSVLNVRNLEEAIYFFSLAHGLSLYDANKLIADFRERMQKEATNSSVPNCESGGMSGTTTLIRWGLLRDIEDVDWATPDALYDSYFPKYRIKFIDYSKHSLLELIRIKNRFLSFIIRNAVIEEEIVPSIEGDTPKTIQRHLISSANRYQNLFPYTEVKSIAAAPNSALKIIDTVIREIRDRSEDLRYQQDMSAFLSSVYSEKSALRFYLDGLYKEEKNEYNKIERKKNKDSVIEEILSEFILTNDQIRPENHPDTAIPHHSYRKSIILYLFLYYGLKLSQEQFDDDLYGPSVYSKDDFYTFIEILDRTLDACGLPLLNPEDKFDFLILKTMQSACYSGENAVDILNEVLALSFSSE